MKKIALAFLLCLFVNTAQAPLLRGPSDIAEAIAASIGRHK